MCAGEPASGQAQKGTGCPPAPLRWAGPPLHLPRQHPCTGDNEPIGLIAFGGFLEIHFQVSVGLQTTNFLAAPAAAPASRLEPSWCWPQGHGGGCRGRRCVPGCPPPPAPQRLGSRAELALCWYSPV